MKKTNTSSSTVEMKELYYGYTRNMQFERKLFNEIGPFVERVRGSDVIFVHQCMEIYSRNIVRYSPKIQVRHMEIDSLSKYFQKVFIYGSSSQKYRDIVCARPLTNWERFLVFRRTVQGQRYSWIKICLSSWPTWYWSSLLGLGKHTCCEVIIKDIANSRQNTGEI